MYYIKYLYVFRAILRSSSRGQNYIVTPSGIVTRPYSAPHGRSQTATILDAVKIQFSPPEDEHSIVLETCRGI
jgi:hypothetical protein